MSGGSQHNPNGRQPQLGAGWSHLQVANFLARAPPLPQVHMGERGVTWHTPTPPPHPIYHVPAPSPPLADPLQGMLLQAMKASGNSVFRHTATPPDLYRHTPTPPDKHLMRHTPSPGDVKTGPPIPPELYPHLGPGREKLRPEELLYGRGVDLSVARAPNGSTAPAAAPAPAAAAAPAPAAASASAPAPALSVRDAPTINSLIARAQPRPGHVRVDALLERLSAPASPHSVIVHPRAAPSPAPPSPPSSNEDSADSCGAPPGSKRKRKPERTVRVPTAPPPAAAAAPAPAPAPPAAPEPTPPPPAAPTMGITKGLAAEVTPANRPPPIENGDTSAYHTPNGPRNPKPETPELTNPKSPFDNPKNTNTPDNNKNSDDNPSSSTPEVHSNPNPKPIEPQIPRELPPTQPEPHTRRKTRSNSAETIDDIAAMIASEKPPPPLTDKPLEPETPVSLDKIKSILSSTETKEPEKDEEIKQSPPKEELPDKPVELAVAPKRRRTRTSNTESTNVPVESPSEAKPAEPDPNETRSAEPTAASFVEVEKQLENMFAGLEENELDPTDNLQTSKKLKRRKSAPTKGETPSAVGGRRARKSTGDRRKGGKKKGEGKPKKQKEVVKDAYDSGSNASSSRSRGPYIQIRGPRDSPLSVSVINAQTGEEDAEAATARRKGPDEYRNGLRARGLHASTLGLRYDATTPDATWLCAFCERGPHSEGLGDLFGPYTVDTDCEEYRMLDEASRRRYTQGAGAEGEAGAPAAACEVWFHEACAVWAPGLLAGGARLWGLPAAVWGARGGRCAHCGKAGAGIACMERGCRARTHVPCARASHWVLLEEEFQARCPRHA